MKSNKVFALVDCNAFFCSCEILFKPELYGKPVGVLSGNDGCFVSRTKELKKLGVPMGAPYFKYKSICDRHKVHIFSSNFSLYTNMSDRVMSVLTGFTPELEVYSVDEAFLNLTGFNDLNTYALHVKRNVERQTGIPVSIGIGSTKTLAKAANYIAKNSERANGICNLMDPKLQDIALDRIAVEDIWGIGRASKQKLNGMRIYTAKEFRDYKNDRLVQKAFTKIGLKTKEELMGYSRFALEQSVPKKKQILCSRSFGRPVYDIESLRQAISKHVHSACEKLRRQGSVCNQLDVFMRTSPFKNVPQYSAFESCEILSATSDTRKVVRYAVNALEKLYRAGYEYKKAGIQLGGINDHEHAQMSLLETPDSEKSDQLMRCIDELNRREGPGTIKTADCGVNDKAWKPKQSLASPRYVSGWGNLPKIS